MAIRLGKSGIGKQIFLGTREADAHIDYLRSFLDLAKAHGSTPAARLTPL
jgi:LysR family transcriptional regulator for metE and metH